MERQLQFPSFWPLLSLILCAKLAHWLRALAQEPAMPGLKDRLCYSELWVTYSTLDHRWWHHLSVILKVKCCFYHTNRKGKSPAAFYTELTLWHLLNSVHETNSSRWIFIVTALKFLSSFHPQILSVPLRILSGPSSNHSFILHPLTCMYSYWH